MTVRATKKESVTIRPAEIKDLPALKLLWLEFMEFHSELGDKYDYAPYEWPHVLQRFSDALRNNISTIFIAEKNGIPLGYTFGFIFNNYPGYYPKEVGFINDFIITAKERNSGTGRLLLHAVEEWFRENGVSVIQLYVAVKNDPGFRFWQACGFENYSLGLWKNI